MGEGGVGEAAFWAGDGAEVEGGGGAGRAGAREGGGGGGGGGLAWGRAFFSAVVTWGSASIAGAPGSWLALGISFSGAASLSANFVPFFALGLVFEFTGVVVSAFGF